MKKLLVLVSLFAVFGLFAGVPSLVKIEKNIAKYSATNQYWKFISEWLAKNKTNEKVWSSYDSIKSSVVSYYATVKSNYKTSDEARFARVVSSYICVECKIFIKEVFNEGICTKYIASNNEYSKLAGLSTQERFEALATNDLSVNQLISYIEIIREFSLDLSDDVVISRIKPLYSYWLTKLPFLTGDPKYNELKKAVSVLGLILKTKGVDIK